MDFKKVFSKLNTKGSKIIIGVVLVLAVISAAFLWVMPMGNTIANGIFVGDTKIGGMTQAEAILALAGQETLSGKNITLLCGENKTEFSGGDAELFYDADATAKMAYEMSRSGDFFENIGFNLSAFFNPVVLDYQVGCNRERLSEIIYNFGVSIYGEKKDYIVEYGEESVRVNKGVSGQGRDVSGALESVLLAVSKGNYEIELGLEKSEPQPPSADGLYEEIYLEPKDAGYVIENKRISFVPEEYGREIDKTEAQAKIQNLAMGEEIILKLNKPAPKVTVASLNAQLFGTDLSVFSTNYSTSDRSRSSNVELAARRINGVILAPGETFSYNEIVGKRTTGNGFKMAGVYENGELVQGIGGGVCQVSSTLYSAVLYANLEILERRSHSMTVGYVPKGQDATVSYGAIDFKFKNNTSSPIKIESRASGGKVTVSIWGAAADKKEVKIINTVVQTKPSIQEEVQSAELAPGVRKTISKGKTGYVVDTVRKVYENGTQIKSENMGRSSYRMVPTKVSVGVGGEMSAPASSSALEGESTPMPRPSSNPVSEVVPDGLETSVPSALPIIPPERENPEVGTTSDAQNLPHDTEKPMKETNTPSSDAEDGE